MRGFLLGKEAETTARFEKKGPDQYIVAFDAAGDMPENEYVLSRFVKPRSTKKPVSFR